MSVSRNVNKLAPEEDTASNRCFKKGFFLHLANLIQTEGHSINCGIVDELVREILINAEHYHSFKIAEILSAKYEDDIGTLDELTCFVHNIIKGSNFSIRKRADLGRCLELTIGVKVPTVGRAVIQEAIFAVAYPFCAIDDLNYCHSHKVCDICAFETPSRSLPLYCIHGMERKEPEIHSTMSIDCCVSCASKYDDTKYTAITRIFSFAAAHHLPYHKGLCQYTHGHEWKLEVTILSPVNKHTGMVLDFSDLKKFVNTYIVDVLDHNYINDVIYNPTAENICFWIWAELSRAGLKGLSSIKVWEAPNSIAEITASMADAYARGLLLCK